MTTNTCHSCGAENDPNFKFCSGCGKELASESNSCSSCGASNDPGFKFCSECGKSLTAVVGECGSCGNVNDPGFKFCSGCGSKLEVRASSPDISVSSERTTAAASEQSYSKTPARQDLVDTYLNTRLLEDQEPVLNELIGAGDVYGLFALAKNALEFDDQSEAEGFARHAVSVATGELLAEATEFYMDVVLLPSSRYEEAEWVCRATAVDAGTEVSEWARNAARKGLDAEGLPEPDLASLLDQIDPRQPTSNTETQERYRDVLIARFVFDHGAGDEPTVRAFDSKTSGHYLASTLDFIDHWDNQYDWLRREVIASAVRSAAVLIDLEERSPWLRGGYLNP